MRSFQLDRRFDAVVCLFSAIGYMPTVHDLDRAVATMVSHLGPGGVFIMDGWVRPDAWDDEEPIRFHHASDGNVNVARMTRSHRDGDTTVLEMHHLIGTRDDVSYAVDRHEMTLFDGAHYEASMRRAGLTAPEVVPSPMPDRDRYIGVTPGR
jgi:SAM-dependent methyltransferase